MELFSVIVLCYRHFEYLFSAIDSVLNQDYPQIELIISDDGSEQFPRKEVAEHICEYKKDNIVNILIHQEKRNVGTVRHLNHIIPRCSGEYITALAGDDAFYDEKVLTQYVKGFAAASEGCLIQMAQTGMYDEELKTLQCYYMRPIVRQAIEHTAEDSTELLRLLISQGGCLPTTSTAYKKGFFERFGQFDESYTLIEDYPMHIRLAEEGWTIHYEDFVAIKHRHGGISHGQSGALSGSSISYFEDNRKTIADIIMKKLPLLPKDERRAVYLRRKMDLRWLDFTLAKLRKDRFRLFCLVLQNPGYSVGVAVRKAWEWAYVWHTKALFYFLGLRFFTPVLADMLQTVLPVSMDSILPWFYAAAVVPLVVWMIAFFIWVANKIMWLLERFPNEVLAIG